MRGPVRYVLLAILLILLILPLVTEGLLMGLIRWPYYRAENGSVHATGNGVRIELAGRWWFNSLTDRSASFARIPVWDGDEAWHTAAGLMPRDQICRYVGMLADGNVTAPIVKAKYAGWFATEDKAKYAILISYDRQQKVLLVANAIPADQARGWYNHVTGFVSSDEVSTTFDADAVSGCPVFDEGAQKRDGEAE